MYALRPSGVYAEYGHRTSLRALQDLSDRLPQGRRDLEGALRDAALDLYTKASQPGAEYFLDKTPRYNLIVDEVVDLFPSASAIVLWRNPLAVVSSILDTWLQRRWMPYLHKIDLFEGLNRLLMAVEKRPEAFVSVRYEDLVADPRAELDRVLRAIGLIWEDDVLDGFTQTRATGRVGDSTGVVKYQSVSMRSLDAWKQVLASPVRKAWCDRYLRWIGADRLALMGYDLEGLRSELHAVPTRYESVPSDLLLSAKGVLWSLFEPDIAKQKWKRLPEWHRIYSHT